jgi:hypothetical protein
MGSLYDVPEAIDATRSGSKRIEADLEYAMDHERIDERIELTHERIE